MSPAECVHMLRTATLSRRAERTCFSAMDVYQEAVQYLESQNIPGESRFNLNVAAVFLFCLLGGGRKNNLKKALLLILFQRQKDKNRSRCERLWAFLPLTEQCLLQWQKKLMSWKRTFSQRRQCPVFSPR